MAEVNTTLLKNKLDVLELKMYELENDFQKLLNGIDRSYARKSTTTSNASENANQHADMQRQIRDIAEKVKNVLLPNETRAYLNAKEIATIKSGFAETQNKIVQLNNLTETLMAIIAKLEADWGSSKVTYK
tara:strand:+ start:167 stop:559 length:393 start_codon:yes stop_codon:yes gene_type:complete